LCPEFSYDRGIGGFDQTFGTPMQQFLPMLMRLAHIAPGMMVLDVATGTGVAAEAALNIVGPSGFVTAVDNSTPMLEEARKRLNKFPNVSFGIENAQALPFPDASFDVVLCGMALMLFPDPHRAMLNFHRVLREGGVLAASVNTTPEHSLTGYLRTLIANRVPSKRAEIEAWHATQFAFGDADRLARAFRMAGFRDIETVLETRQFSFPSFDAYFDPIAEGSGLWGTEFVQLPTDIRRQIREDLRHEMEGEETRGGAVTIDVDILLASGRR
jgi:ubiquinone/menaquinone biosynthesis C-methylase UbiE